MTWLNLLRWEWFKLRGRRVIWLLLAVLIIPDIGDGKLASRDHLGIQGTWHLYPER